MRMLLLDFSFLEDKEKKIVGIRLEAENCGFSDMYCSSLAGFLAKGEANVVITDEKIIFKCPEEEDYERKIKPEEAEQLKQLKELLKSDKKLFICRKGLFNRGFKIVSEGFRCNYPTEISRKVFIVENK